MTKTTPKPVPVPASIAALGMAELKSRVEKLSGAKPKSQNKPYLQRLLARLEHEKAQAEAAAPPKAKKPGPRKATPKATDRDERLPPVGTIIEREHDGKKHKVEVLADGFRYHGKVYGSLSTVAKEITGTIWNGLLFFKLIPYASRKANAA